MLAFQGQFGCLGELGWGGQDLIHILKSSLLWVQSRWKGGESGSGDRGGDVGLRGATVEAAWDGEEGGSGPPGTAPVHLSLDLDAESEPRCCPSPGRGQGGRERLVLCHAHRKLSGVLLHWDLHTGQAPVEGGCLASCARPLSVSASTLPCLPRSFLYPQCTSRWFPLPRPDFRAPPHLRGPLTLLLPLKHPQPLRPGPTSTSTHRQQMGLLVHGWHRAWGHCESHP